jgi:hypothetical protein
MDSAQSSQDRRSHLNKLKVLHERTFDSKPLKSFKVYDDPFGEGEVCVELVFLDGEIEYVAIASGRPQIVSNGSPRDSGDDDLTHGDSRRRRTPLV